MLVRKMASGTLALLVALSMIVGWGGGASMAGAAVLPGLASLSGSVDSPTSFKAARVYIHNLDKRIMYMVYTNAGQFRAVDLFPGEYEVNVVGKGLESEKQKVTLKAGDSPKLKLSLKESKINALPVATGLGVPFDKTPDSPEAFVSYDEMYPPGPGRDVLERTCMICHGENFLPMNPGSEAAWNTRIDHMMGPDVVTGKRPAASYAEGMLQYRDPRFSFTKQDRDDLLNYMVKYFGPDSKRRVVKIEKEFPVDEAKLGKAMYMEYYWPEDPPGQLSNAEGGSKPWGQDVHFDAEGNVYMSDRGIPRRLRKLDPRTGVQKEWLSPHPKYDVHEVLVGRDGIIWMPEHTEGGLPSHLLCFNPKTEKWECDIDVDPGNVVRNPIKWMQSVTFDSKDNLYMGWIMGGAISKYDRETRKATVFPVPTAAAIVYGIVADRNDFVYAVQWNGGKIARFDTHNNSFTEFTPPTYPSHMRRGNIDLEGNYWVGIWAAGKRPAKLEKLDTKTGRWTEFEVPAQNAQPYDVQADPENNLWVSDVGYTATIWKFDQRNHTFTYYPKPQRFSDSPKIQVTKDGAVWYSPRQSKEHPAFGVLYPDMDKITSFGAYYLNGPPGYPFKSTTASQPAKASTKEQASASSGPIAPGR